MLSELQSHLLLLKEQNILVVVEGAKDRLALNYLGVDNVITLNKPLFAIVEEVARVANECVVLTDLDGEGRRLYARLARDLNNHGVKVNNAFRNFLFRETSLRQIEGLATYINNAGQRAGHSQTF